MYIIQIEPFENGARPPLQSWNSAVQPDGYAFCDEAQKDVFYSTTPAGFVNIEIGEEQGYKVVTHIEVNQAALDAYNEYIASLPEPEEVIPEPTQLDRIEAQVAYTAMQTGTTLEEAEQ